MGATFKNKSQGREYRMNFVKGLAVTVVALFSMAAQAQVADPVNYNINCRFRSAGKPPVRCHVVANLHEGTPGAGRDHLLVNCTGPGVIYNGVGLISTTTTTLTV